MAESTNSAGAAKLAKKRAASLSPERRREIAREAAKERWNGEIDDVSHDIPRAEFPGELEIGELTIPCVLKCATGK